MPDQNRFPSPFKSCTWSSREEATDDLARSAETECALPGPGRSWRPEHINSVDLLLGRLTPDVPAAHAMLSRAPHMVTELNENLLSPGGASGPSVRAVAMAMVAVLLATVDCDAARLWREAARRSRSWTVSDLKHKLRQEIESAAKHGPAAFLNDTAAGAVVFAPDRWIAETFERLLNGPTLRALTQEQQAVSSRAVAPVVGWARSEGRGHMREDLQQEADLRVMRVLVRGLELGKDDPNGFLGRCANNAARTECGRAKKQREVPLEAAPEPAAAAEDSDELSDDGSWEVLLWWLEANAESLVEDTEFAVASRRLERPKKAKRISELLGSALVDDSLAASEAFASLRNDNDRDTTKDGSLALRQAIYAILMVRAPEDFPPFVNMKKKGKEREVPGANAETAPGKAVAKFVEELELLRRLRAWWRHQNLPS